MGKQCCGGDEGEGSDETAAPEEGGDSENDEVAPKSCRGSDDVEPVKKAESGESVMPNQSFAAFCSCLWSLVFRLPVSPWPWVMQPA